MSNACVSSRVGAVHHVVVVQSRLGGLRVELHQPKGVWIDPARRNPVAGERIAHEARSRGDHARDRIDLAELELTRRGRVEHRAARKGAPEDVGADRAALQGGEIREVREAARALGRRRNRPDPRARLLDDAALVVGEPERLRADGRPARREPVLVRQVLALLDVGAVGEEVVGVHRVVAVELPGAPARLLVPDLSVVFSTAPPARPYSALKELVMILISSTASTGGLTM